MWIRRVTIQMTSSNDSIGNLAAELKKQEKGTAYTDNIVRSP